MKRFVLVQETSIGLFMDEPTLIHKVDIEEGSFSESAYFVDQDYYIDIVGLSDAANKTPYVAVSFPESQLFMNDYGDEIYLINDEHGVHTFGCAAYFIEENLYKTVKQNFDKFSPTLPFDIEPF